MRSSWAGVAAVLMASVAACGPAHSRAAGAAVASGPVAVPGARPAAFKSDRIAVQVVGRGPDVILIPGLSSSPRAWGGLVGAAPGYRYHLVQLNGFAGLPASGAASGQTVAEPAAEEIARYIASAGLKRPAVIGHSMGGTMAMMLAARHPERVGKLMVVDMMPFMGAMFGGPMATPQTLAPIADQVAAGIKAGAVGPGRQAAAEKVIAGMVKTERLRVEPVADTLASDPDVSARAMRELIVTDLRPELARITVPTTVLYVKPTGAPFTDAQMDAFYRASYATLPAAKLTRIDDSAHFIMLDQPQRFASEVKAFLTSAP